MFFQLRRTCVQEQVIGGVRVVRLLEGELREANSQAIGQRLYPLAGALAGATLHLDLGNVWLMSSSGLGMLVAPRRKVCAAGGHLVLANVDPGVYKAFAVTRLDKLFDMRPVGL